MHSEERRLAKSGRDVVVGLEETLGRIETDAVVAVTDQVQFIDITPEQLRARVAHAEVVGSDMAVSALSGFFSADRLAALRRLGLRWLDEHDLLDPAWSTPCRTSVDRSDHLYAYRLPSLALQRRNTQFGEHHRSPARFMRNSSVCTCVRVRAHRQGRRRAIMAGRSAAVAHRGREALHRARRHRCSHDGVGVRPVRRGRSAGIGRDTSLSEERTLVRVGHQQGHSPRPGRGAPGFPGDLIFNASRRRSPWTRRGEAAPSW